MSLFEITQDTVILFSLFLSCYAFQFFKGPRANYRIAYIRTMVLGVLWLLLSPLVLPLL